MQRLAEKKRLMTTTLTTPFIYYNRAPGISQKAEEFLNKANEAFEKQDIRATTEHYKNALEEAPQSAELVSNVGAVLAAQGVAHEGLRFLQRALEANSQCVGALYNLGTLFLAHGMGKEAQEQLQKAYELDQQSAPIMNNLAIAHLHLSEFEKARELLEQAITKIPSFDYGFHNLGTISYDQDKLDEAISWFEKGLVLNENNFATLSDVACCYYLMGDTDKAVLRFKKAIDCNPHYRLPYFNLGYIMYANTITISA